MAKRSDDLVKQFPFLITQGASDQRTLLKEVRAAYETHVQSVVHRVRALALLSNLDVCEELEGINTQALLVFGEQDALIAKDYVSQLRSRWASKENLELALLSGVGHFPFVAVVVELLRARLVCSRGCERNTTIRDAGVK